jgi:hypothetical protein
MCGISMRRVAASSPLRRGSSDVSSDAIALAFTKTWTRTPCWRLFDRNVT